MAVFEFFKAIFSSRLNIFLTIVLSAVYYFAIQYVIALNAPSSFVFTTIPNLLIELLAFSAAALLVISIYSVRFSLAKLEGEAEGVFSALSAIAGGVIAGCNCSVPIIASIMYLFALDAATVSSVLAFLGNYQLGIFSVLIIANVVLSHHHLAKLSHTCKISKGKIVARK